MLKEDKEDSAAAPADAEAISDEAVSSALAEIEDKKAEKMQEKINEGAAIAAKQ